MAIHMQLVQASRDRRLHGEAFRALVACHAMLVEHETRPLKIAALAHTLHADPYNPGRPATRTQFETTARAVRTLRRLGYLVRGVDVDGFRMYRLDLPPLPRNTSVTRQAA